jgi:hypothetical protein
MKITLTTLLLSITIGIACISTLSCCKKKEKTIDDIVPITQMGANTFACLVDGQIASTQLYSNALAAEGVEYSMSTKYLWITAITKNPRRDFQIAVNLTTAIRTGIFNANEFVLIGYSTLNNSGGIAPQGGKYYLANSNLPATVTISKFTGNAGIGNVEGDILSGTFDMVLANAGGEKIHITQGRFDIKAN